MYSKWDIDKYKYWLYIHKILQKGWSKVKAKIRLNKMVKTLSIQRGNQIVGYLDIDEITDYILGNEVEKNFKDSVDGKTIMITSDWKGLTVITKGKTNIRLDSNELFEYCENKTLDIKYFEQV